MRKTLLFLVISLALLSCANEETYMKSIPLTVKSSDWAGYVDVDELNLYFSATFNVPEINSYIYKYGNVQVYYYASNAQQPLPYVQHNENVYGNLWTRTIDYRYSRGSLTIYLTNSDFYDDGYNPEAMDFRVVLTWQESK